MMALGAPSIGFAGSQLSDVAQYSYSQIGSALFQDTIGRGLKNWLGARFSIIPALDNDPYSTKIVAKKKWSDKLSTSAITSITAFDHLKIGI